LAAMRLQRPLALWTGWPGKPRYTVDSRWHGDGTAVSRLRDMSEFPTVAGWQLRLVGGVAARRTGGTWEVPAGSRKSRTLLGLLGAQHASTVTVDYLVNALWEGKPPQQPEANVATLVSRLRVKFDPDIIVGGRSGYRLGASTRVDLHDAAALIWQARALLRDGRPAAALIAAERGVLLLGGGPVLTDYPATEWAGQARHMQSELLRRGRLAAAECALRTNAPQRAQRFSEAAIAADPLDEAAYRMLMSAYVATGEPARALVTYERLRSTLVTELGTAPAPQTRALRSEILLANADPT
jgi:DNA-binding SARP family transcriptional activator